MSDRRVRQDTVAEIEDERLCRESLQHILDRAVERDTAGTQHLRVEIALHRHAGLDLRAGEFAINAGFQAYGIDAGLIDIARDFVAGAAGEADDFRAGDFGAQLRNE